MVDDASRTNLISLYQTAVARAQPERCLPGLLPDWPAGRIIAIACGKAGASMAHIAEQHYAEAVGEDGYKGVAITRHGYGLALRNTRLIEAGHPVPDDSSILAADTALEMAQAAGAHDLVLVLLSGGASALCAAPLAGLTLRDKQTLTHALLRSGATISQINCVRKHLSRFKGGRLAAAAAPAHLVTLAISDVPGDAPDAIGSGPTVPDPTTLAEARDVLSRYSIAVPPAVMDALQNPANETPKQGDPAFTNSAYQLAATAAQSLEAAGNQASAFGYRPIILGDAVEGEARDLASGHGAQALALQAKGERVALLSGGEATVTLRGNGQGGPNQEYALALALALNGAQGICAIAADTDGADGGAGAPDDPAGALIDPTTLSRSFAANRDPVTFLENNNSREFFETLGDLVITGPSRTNVNDFRAILIDPPTATP